MKDICHIYARSLAEEIMAEKLAREDIHKLQALLQEEDIAKFLRSPTIKAEQYHQFKDIITQKLSLHKLTKNFLSLVIKNKRQNLLAEIVDLVPHYLDKIEGVKELCVTSAAPLKENQLNIIKNNFEKITNSHVKVKSIVDPNLLYGLTVQFNSIMVDASLKGKLTKLRNKCKENLTSL